MKPKPSPALCAAGRKRHSGFTLAEVMVASALASLILAGTMSSFLMICRSSQRLFYYTRMEDKSRITLEGFAEDVRMANNVTTNSTASVTLTVPDNYPSNGNQVTYAYGSVTVNSVPYSNCFYRQPGNAASGATPTILLQNVTGCVFNHYDVLGSVASTDSATKRLEIQLTESLTDNGNVTSASDSLVSATFVLRNKI